MRLAWPAVAAFAAAATAAACTSPPSSASSSDGDQPEVLYETRPASWFEHLTDGARVAPDGRTALYGTGARTALITFGAGAAAAPAIEMGGEPGSRVWSPDRRRLATFDTAKRTAGVTVDGVAHPVPGHLLNIEWTPDAQRLVTLTRAADDTVALGTLDLATSAFRVVADGLDGDVFPAQFAVTPDGRAAVLALASAGTPDPAVRHDPTADRDLDLWRVDLATGERTAVVQTSGDDFSPSIAGDALYWVHAEVTPSVVIVPIDGGTPRAVVTPGELPYWRPDGRQLGVMVGGWRLRDMALPLDAHVVDLDAQAAPIGSPRPLVAGFHEDFTPAWSPDGRWLAFHSHRSPTPVTSYAAAGSTDDVWIARADDPAGSQRRLTDFGYEAGMADWAPDGRRLIFTTQDRAAPGTPAAWIVDVDPETGRSTKVTRLALPEGAASAETVAWSPDGATIAVESKAGEGRHALWLVPVERGTAERLLEYPTATYGGVDWTPDGRTLVFGALAEERMQIHAIDLVTRAVVQLTRSADGAFLPQVSPDGRRVAATSIRHVRRIVRQPWRSSAAEAAR